MADDATRRRYTQPGYLPAVRARRRGEQVKEPAHTDLRVVEVTAIQGGKRRKVRVTEDRVEQYKQVLASTEEGSDGSSE